MTAASPPPRASSVLTAPDRLSAISASQALSAQSSPNNYVPSGSTAVDALLGGHGFSKGVVTDISGPPSSGKTAIAARAAAHVSSAGLKVVWIDTAYALPQDRLLPLTTRPELITYLYLPSLAHLISFFQRPPHDLSFSLLVLDELSSPYLLAFPPGLDTTPAGKKISQRRYPIMVSLAHSITALAARHNAAVIVLQKSATRVVQGFGGVLAPAVGFRGWCEAVGWRVILYRREEGRRYGSLLKARGRVYQEGEGPEMEILVGKDGAIVDGEDDESQYGYHDDFRDEIERVEEYHTHAEEESSEARREATPPIPKSPPQPTPSPITLSPASPPPLPTQPASSLTITSPTPSPQNPSQPITEAAIDGATHNPGKQKRGIEAGIIPDSEDEEEDEILLGE